MEQVFNIVRPFVDRTSFKQKNSNYTPIPQSHNNSLGKNTQIDTLEIDNNNGSNKNKILMGFGLASAVLVTGLLFRSKCKNIIKNLFYKAKIRHLSPSEICAQECKNLTFNTPNLKLMKDYYGDKNVYDLGLRYAHVSRNTARTTGQSTIIMDIPEMFKDLKENEIIKALDELRCKDLPYDEDGVFKFLIGNKTFEVRYLGVGNVNSAYVISDSLGHKLCYKFPSYPLNSNIGHGIHNEAAITIEANKAGVVDTMKLYMTNMLASKTPQNRYVGGWQLTEFIDGTKQAPPQGLKLRDWLKSKGLRHIDLDDHAANSVNGYVVDMGGIISDVKENPYSHMLNVNSSTFPA